MSSLAIQKAPPAAVLNAAVATSQIFPTQASAALFGGVSAIPTACALVGPGGKRLEAKRFEVRASGTCTTAGAYTVLATLYAAVVAPIGAASLVPANWTIVAAGTATAVGTTSAGWLIQTELFLDSLSGKLIGHYDSNTNNVYVSKAALNNQISGLNGQTEPVLVFAVGITFSAANAGNSATLTDFVLDA